MRVASEPNHGCQSFTWTPRNAPLSTFKLLTAGIGAFVAEAFAAGVTFAGGVRVPVSDGTEGVHAEKMKTSEKSVMQILRKSGISRQPRESERILTKKRPASQSQAPGASHPGV